MNTNTVNMFTLGYIMEEIKNAQPNTQIDVSIGGLLNFGACVCTFNAEGIPQYEPVKTVLVVKHPNAPHPFIVFSPYEHPVTSEYKTVTEVRGEALTVLFNDKST